MTIKVVAYWESEANNFRCGRDIDMDVWRECVKPWTYDLIMVDKDSLDPTCDDLDMTYATYATVEAALDANSSYTAVFLEKQSNCPPEVTPTNLIDFTHPAGDTLYIVGPDSSQLDLASLYSNGYLDGNHVVYINTTNNIAMWSMSSVCIALYDRSSKS